ncbi:methyltransferase domain-containing protein [Planktomarina temperata]|nr:methyltransferase domain-containing protein [Planktomarina temperata]
MNVSNTHYSKPTIVSNTDRQKFSFTNFSDHFDEHISNSIRGYSTLKDDVVSISKYFVEDNTTVLDIGCSEGTLIKRIYDHNDQSTQSQFIGVDINDSFKRHWTNTERISYLVDDVTMMSFPKNCSFVTSLFTLQFLSERERPNLFKKIFDSLVMGGGFCLSEKLLSDDGKTQNMMDFLYYDFKRSNFTEKEILDKEVELRHLSKSISEDQLIKQLKSVGFSKIQTFWRNFNFVGLVCFKPYSVGNGGLL